MPGRTIAIGDVHGCSLALGALLDAIGPSPEDLIIPLGDYIDRGPDSRGVLDRMIALRVCCTVVPLLGNHEEMLLAALRDHTALRLWLACGGTEAVASYSTRLRPPTHPDSLAGLIPQEHLSFLRACRSYHETDTHIFVHAGYVPDLPMSQQPGEALCWQYVDRQAARPHCSGKTAVVGHTPQRDGRVLDLGFLKCIDTCCHAGQWLTALDVHTGRLWQADAQGRIRPTKSAE